jgi:hypothetical protein
MMEKEKYRSMFDAFHTEHKNLIRHWSGWVFYYEGFLKSRTIMLDLF